MNRYRDHNQEIEGDWEAEDEQPSWACLLAEFVLDELEGMSEGEEVSTSQLVHQLKREPEAALSEGIRTALQVIEEDEFKMFELESALYQLALRHGLELDKSAYDGMKVGLPFHIPFVVRHNDTAVN